jgi:hypothetical protein
MLAVFQLNVAISALLADQHALVLKTLDEAPPTPSPLVNQLNHLVRGAWLTAAGETLDAEVHFAAVDPALVGRPFSAQAAQHGALLIRAFAAEGHVVGLRKDPDAHAPALRALLVACAGERKPVASTLLDCLLVRVERGLAGV